MWSDPVQCGQTLCMRLAPVHEVRPCAMWSDTVHEVSPCAMWSDTVPCDQTLCNVVRPCAMWSDPVHVVRPCAWGPNLCMWSDPMDEVRPCACGQTLCYVIRPCACGQTLCMRSEPVHVVRPYGWGQTLCMRSDPVHVVRPCAWGQTLCMRSDPVHVDCSFNGLIHHWPPLASLWMNLQNQEAKAFPVTPNPHKTREDLHFNNFYFTSVGAQHSKPTNQKSTNIKNIKRKH